MFYRRIVGFLSIALVISLFSGCATYRLEKIGRDNWVGRMSHSALTTGDISYKTRQFLVGYALMQKFDDDPGYVIRTLAEHVDNPHVINKEIPDGGNVRNSINALIELCMYQAREESDEKAALKYWISCSYYSYKSLFDKTIRPPVLPYNALAAVTAVRYYNISLSQVFAYLRKHKIALNSCPEMEMIRGKVKFGRMKSNLIWPISIFKNYLICYDYLPVGFNTHSFTSGLGVPIVGVRDKDARPEKYREMTLLARSYPFTFLLKFESFKLVHGVVKAEPELFDNCKSSFAEIDKFKIPLARDFTVALAKFLEGKRYIHGIKYMFSPDKMKSLQGLYLLTPYDPNKIPVVLVHGLMSDPATWIQVFNTLIGDPEISRNYQFWFYAYPTGQPVIFSASQFRNALLEVQKKYDPLNNQPKFDEMVIIGHSMGGLLTRLSVQDSQGEGLIKKIFGRSLDKSKFTPEQQKFIKDILVFKPLPFVQRVVFIATPHQGAEMANWLISRFGSWLISLPANITNKSRSILKKIAVNSGLMKKDYPVEISTGIDNLKPDNPMIKATCVLPIRKGVKCHSIIGDNLKAGHKGGTDGIVPYWSSHRDDVESEVIVHSGHSAHQTPEAIRELKRILYLHLRENGLLKE